MNLTIVGMDSSGLMQMMRIGVFLVLSERAGTARIACYSSAIYFGGSGEEKPLSYKAKKQECDGRDYSIAYPLAGYGVAVFRFSY